ncbi:MAG: glycosyltransferase family 2 protein [Mobiluncus porci]|uniref:glycosyltransferase family 2 protein n=1 Tax=Mobiluncus TaxID=2050 RepID=UPI0023F2AB4B|nr:MULTISPECIES: glycosyltransferase family 2 protein [Mobiluncus]MCI6583988.1 glycosyltransferase family 2 protein [Mobiluncus sp.]MDD7542506.1 glycosyltransferase family 2 protein [Mobiluncus porci]MDY5748803.1 glycosyltransferase family 2 protein [Mobiluncus porci]
MENNRVWAIGVAYNPDQARLTRTIESLLPQVERVLIVDNTPDPTPALKEYWRSWVARGVAVVAVGKNLGIAAAQNLGARRALRGGAAALLFFDHDSVFASDYVATIQEAYGRLVGDVGALGGLAFDAREADSANRDVLAYRDTSWGPRRWADAALRLHEVLPAAFLIASGLYVPRQTWERVGPMNAEMFIDHVDLEWSARAKAKGCGTYLVAGATIDHQLGDEVVKLPGRAQVVHVHTPFRVYYLVRNTVWLIRGLAPITPTWRIGYLIWLTKYIAFNLVFVPNRLERAKKILKGLRDGFKPFPKVC